MLKRIAQFISIIFHPLLMPTYMLILLMKIDPYSFGLLHLGEPAGNIVLLKMFFSTFLIPAFGVLTMKMLGFVKSFELDDKTERIGPYILTGLFYLWMYINFKDHGDIPNLFSSFMLGAVISLFLAFIINIFSKISAHSVGMGGLVAMCAICLTTFSYKTLSFDFPLSTNFYLSTMGLFLIAIVLAGLTGTARLILKAHQPRDVFGGYLVGIVGMLVAMQF